MQKPFCGHVLNKIVLQRRLKKYFIKWIERQIRSGLIGVKAIWKIWICIWKMYIHDLQYFLIKGALSGLSQFMAIESPLKMMKNAFYFTSKALFVLSSKFLSWLFGHVTKRLDKKDKVNIKFYDVTAWLANNCNTHIAQYLEN